MEAKELLGNGMTIPSNPAILERKRDADRYAVQGVQVDSVSYCNTSTQGSDIDNILFRSIGMLISEPYTPSDRSLEDTLKGPERYCDDYGRATGTPLAWGSQSKVYSMSTKLARLAIGSCLIWGLGTPVVQAQSVPDWLLHTFGGMTIAASACVPALQAVEDKPDAKAYRIALYIAWAVCFTIFMSMELYQRRDQGRLLLGLVVFCGANLLGSLAESSSTTIDTVINWGPLCLSVSLWVVPAWIQVMGGRRAAEAVVGA